jgi:hypothetical protein
MFEETIIRVLAASILAALGWGFWKLLGHLVLGRARAGSAGKGSLPAGFVPGLPGLLVFGSPDCRTCVSAQKPAVRRLADSLGPSVQILDVDVTIHPELAERYGVLSLPTTFILDHTGSPRKVNHGFVASAELQRQLAPYLIA